MEQPAERNNRNIADTAGQADIYANIDAWQGNIDGRIPVLMWYRIHEDVVSGYLFYTDNKTKDSIRIIGTTGDSIVRLLEIFPDGNITGIWDLEIHSSAAEGAWFSPKTLKEHGTSLMHIDTAVSIQRIDSVNDISGVYRYGYSAEGSQGYMSVERNKEAVMVKFINSAGEPERNPVTFGPFSATITDNQIIYTSNDYGACTVRIRFFNDFVVVNCVDDKNKCGAAYKISSVEGVYIKTK